jgi:hypothetical protein
MLRMGELTSFKMREMKCFVEGLPLSTYVLMAEQMAPPFRLRTKSVITASHFIRSSGSCTQRYNFLKLR